jgi:hypothetical protein
MEQKTPIPDSWMEFKNLLINHFVSNEDGIFFELQLLRIKQHSQLKANHVNNKYSSVNCLQQIAKKLSASNFDPLKNLTLNKTKFSKNNIIQ